jgi:uncharacterized protein YndB with AHSA1/START domain
MTRLSIVRVFDAPREEVWRAWTEPERLASWWGRRGWSTPVGSVELDVRPGGVFRLNSINEDDGREMPLDAVFHEVVPLERLVFADQQGATSSVTFRDLGDGRTEMRFEATVSPGVADAAAAGLASAFDRLEESLARASSA